MRDEIRSLTTLRFVAAFWVFVFHIHIRWPLPLPVIPKALVDQGAVGMTLFFVLSGFVLAYSNSNGIGSIGDYAKRRFARIYPVYLLAGVVTLPFLALEQEGWAGLFEGCFVILVNIFMLQAWFPPLFHYWNIGASWSLSAEAFFYLTFPFLIVLFNKSSTRHVIVGLASAYALSVLPGLSYLLIPNSPPIYYSVPIFRLPEFVVGVACGVLFNRGLINFERPRAICVGATLALVIFLTVVPQTTIYVTANVLAVPCLAAVILSMAQMRSPVLDNRILVSLGRASYAFYSLQALLILGMIELQRGQPLWSPLLTLVFSLIALTGLALGTYLYLEEPVRKWLTRRESESYEESHIP